MMWVGDIAAASQSIGECALTEQPAIVLRDRSIRVEDVVVGNCPLLAQPRMRNAIIAIVPAGQTGADLSRHALARLVRRRIPALTLSTDRGEQVVVFRASAKPASNRPLCYAAAAPLRDGQAIVRRDLSATACAHAVRPPVRYDRTYGIARADGDIAVGAYLGPVSGLEAAGPDSGDTLTAVAIEGATRVERPVTALQPASRGRALFVRDGEGHIFAAPLHLDTNGSAR
jgi:hypothetical protein